MSYQDPVIQISLSYYKLGWDGCTGIAITLSLRLIFHLQTGL